MAKKTGSVVNTTLLAGIATGAVGFVSKADGLPLINHEPPLIGVDVNQTNGNGDAKVWLTDAGKALLPNGNAAKSDLARADTPIYAVVSNIALPEPVARKRGGFGGGAPTVYPWATMDVGAWFFVPVSDKHPDPAKSMTSAVSSANMKYSEEYGEEKPYTRTKRGEGNKAIKDEAGNLVKETIMRKDRKAVKKFELWGKVEAGKNYNGYTPPSDGVIVRRVI